MDEKICPKCGRLYGSCGIMCPSCLQKCAEQMMESYDSPLIQYMDGVITEIPIEALIS